MAKVGDIGWFWSGYAPKTLGVISKIVELETFSYFYAEGLANSYMNFEPMTDEELAELGLVRKEKLDKAKECLEFLCSEDFIRKEIGGYELAGMHAGRCLRELKIEEK